MKEQWEGTIDVTLTATFSFEIEEWDATDKADARRMVEASIGDSIANSFHDNEFEETWKVDGEVI